MTLGSGARRTLLAQEQVLKSRASMASPIEPQSVPGPSQSPSPAIITKGRESSHSRAPSLLRRPSHSLKHEGLISTTKDRAAVDKPVHDYDEGPDSGSDAVNGDDDDDDDTYSGNKDDDDDEEGVIRMLGARRSRGERRNSSMSASAHHVKPPAGVHPQTRTRQGNEGANRERVHVPGRHLSFSPSSPKASFVSHEEEEVDELQSSSSSSAQRAVAKHRRGRRDSRTTSTSRSRSPHSESFDNGESKG